MLFIEWSSLTISSLPVQLKSAFQIQDKILRTKFIANSLQTINDRNDKLHLKIGKLWLFYSTQSASVVAVSL